MRNICIVEECNEPIHIKKWGYCSPHYQKFWKYGDALYVTPAIDKPNKPKTCNICKEEKARECFDSGRNYCYSCQTVIRAERRLIDKAYADRVSEANKLRKMSSKGWIPERVAVMLYAQGGLCYICTDSLYDQMHKDHDHNTGEPRGLLCKLCNPGIGFFKDNPDLLDNAAAYLRALGY